MITEILTENNYKDRCYAGPIHGWQQMDPFRHHFSGIVVALFAIDLHADWMHLVIKHLHMLWPNYLLGVDVHHDRSVCWAHLDYGLVINVPMKLDFDLNLCIN